MIDRIKNHISGYIRNEKKNNSLDDKPTDSIINNTTTTQNTENNMMSNNSFTVNIQYEDIYRTRYQHHPRHNHQHSELRFDDKLFRSTLRDITNFKFDCYRRDFLINFLNSMF